MATWEAREPNYRLKAVGAADWELDANWFDQHPNQTTLIRFSNKTPASIRPDDLLLYYASGHQKLFGIVAVFTKPVRDEGEERWPWSAQVRSKVIISQLERAPGIDLLVEADPSVDWRLKVQQMDYREVSQSVFDHAAAALVALAQPELGDILEESFRARYAASAAKWRSGQETD